jgi:hypothetical protein
MPPFLSDDTLILKRHQVHIENSGAGHGFRAVVKIAPRGGPKKKFIPREKLSKKTQRELNLKKRRTWGALNPATRKPKNPKAYDRKKVQREDDHSIDELDLF